MKLRAKWSCAPPNVGDYLMSTQRPRFAYRIEGCEVGKQPISNVMPERTLTITASRVKASAVPEGAVHAWKWDSRGPKAAVRNPAMKGRRDGR